MTASTDMEPDAGTKSVTAFMQSSWSDVMRSVIAILKPVKKSFKHNLLVYLHGSWNVPANATCIK